MNSEKFNKLMKAIHEAELRDTKYKFNLAKVHHGFSHGLFCSSVRYDSATLGPPAKVSFLLKVTDPFCNKTKQLHGGCASTLIDVTSTGLLIGLSRPGLFSRGGVTRTLHVKFLRPVPVGMEVRVVNELVHAGKRLALVRPEIRGRIRGSFVLLGNMIRLTRILG
ncbi:hypothetical protein GX48_05486 [Paracoccidioides brasiliensis]|nr:hypothetical protein GX48_05486 [Paracoccidioides brasiliensis]